MGSVLILELFLLSLYVINCRLDGMESTNPSFNQIYLAQNKTSYLKHNYILHVSRIIGT